MIAYLQRDSRSAAGYAAVATDSRPLLGPLLLPTRLPSAPFANDRTFTQSACFCSLSFSLSTVDCRPFFGSRPASEAQKWRFVSPLFATLTDSLSRKSFPCHSYANTRDGGGTTPPISNSNFPRPLFSWTYELHYLRTILSSEPSALLPAWCLTASLRSVPRWQIFRTVILFLGIAAREA